MPLISPLMPVPLSSCLTINKIFDIGADLIRIRKFYHGGIRVGCNLSWTRIAVSDCFGFSVIKSSSLRNNSAGLFLITGTVYSSELCSFGSCLPSSTVMPTMFLCSSSFLYGLCFLLYPENFLKIIKRHWIIFASSLTAFAFLLFIDD